MHGKHRQLTTLTTTFKLMIWAKAITATIIDNAPILKQFLYIRTVTLEQKT
jgi:hypothetical protein